MWLEIAGLKEDLVLVKSYDRAFWLRHFERKNKSCVDERFKPDDCPFDSPEKNSMLKDWF